MRHLLLTSIIFILSINVKAMDSKPSLTIQVASDLHLEFYDNFDDIPEDIIVPSAPILALVGDIALTHTEVLKDFLYFQSQRFEKVLYVAGNHEFYHTNSHSIKTVAQQIQWIQDICEEKDNLFFLEQGTLDISGVRFLGTTLWSDIPDSDLKIAENGMSDYRLTYITDEQGQLVKLKPTHTRSWHKDNVKWLKSQIQLAENENIPVVVLTHHTPFIEGAANPLYNESPLTSCFSTDLSSLLGNPVIKYWVSGHTHYNFDRDVKGTKVVSNQRGYPTRVKDTYDHRGKILSVFTHKNKSPLKSLFIKKRHKLFGTPSIISKFTQV